MKSQHALAGSLLSCLAGLLFVLASSGHVQGTDPVLFGTAHDGKDGPSDLYSIDTQTGTATLVGPIGFERVSAMDFDSSSGTLYATGERSDGSDIMVFITIDPFTGIGAEIGPTGLPPEGSEFTIMTDLSFRESDNKLFGYTFTNCCPSVKSPDGCSTSYVEGVGLYCSSNKNS